MLVRRCRAIAPAVGGALVLLLLAIGGPSAAEAQGRQFRHLRADDGLAGSWVQTIVQDNRGFMWFGTVTGLSRYDGYSMTTYRHDKADPRTLPDHSVFALHEDRRGVLWIGTRRGLSRYERTSDSFTNFMVREQDDPITQRQVRAIHEDSRGILWVGTSRGLYRFDRARGIAVDVTLPPSPTGHGHYIQAIIEDKRRHILIGTNRDGIFDYDPATGTMRQFAQGRAGVADFPTNNVQSLAEDKKGRLWVGTYGAGLLQFDPVSGQTTKYAHDPRDPASLSINHVTKIAVDHDGWLWLATENGGLEHFDPSTGRFTHNRSDPNNADGVASDSFWSVLVDATGTLWAGTFQAGVDVLRPVSRAIQRYHVIGGDTASLSHNSVVGFAQDSTGLVWIATDGGGLNRLDPAIGRFRRYTTKTSNLNKDAVLAASVDRNGMIWIGTWEGGLSMFDPRTERFTAYTTKNSNIPDDHIFAVHVDRKNRIWVGTWQKGLALFDPVTKSFTSYHYGQPGHESQVWIIREMADGRLLLGTPQNGMAVFDPETGTSITYGGRAVGGHGAISAFDVRAIAEESPGVVWAGTPIGLNRVDLRTGAVAQFGVKDGLPSSHIMGLEFDGAGQLWVSTDNGLARFDRKHQSAWNLSVEDGLQAREFAARSSARLRDGRLLFGGASGFNLVQTALLRRNTTPPRVVFTGFQVFNKPVPIGVPGSPLTEHISEAKEIRLSYRQSVFTFEFAALDFMAASKNRYAYRLEGFDEDWTEVGANRSATYTSLAPDRYVFRVKASNNDGVWNEQGSSIVLVITPPFWATWWFRSLVVLAIVAVVASIIRSAQARHRALRALNGQLGRAAERDRESQQYLERNVLDILGAMQRFSGGDYSVALDVDSEDSIGKLRLGFNSVVADRKRAEEELRQSQKMEAVGRLAGGVAHDFNNLLTVIKGNAELALADVDSKELVREELEEIERAAERASSLTRQLLAFSRKQILKPQRLMLNDMVVELGRMLRRTVGEDIELRIVMDPMLGPVRADPGQIEQVLLNLVVNARDAMPRGGVLSIETRNVDAAALRHHGESENVPYVALIVTDTGTGMEEAVRERVFEPFFTTKEQGKGTGLGLSTVYGSVKQSGGYVMVESQTGQGSTFSIYLPRVEAVEEPRMSGELEAMPRGTATVLLVEDEDAVRRLGSRVLLRSGYTVLTASCGDEALEVAARHVGPIDLLLTDVVMPGMSGRELAERLMPRHPGMRLLYASGYTEDAIIRHGVSSQQTAFLEKPFTPNALLRKVRQVLEAAPLEEPAQLAS